MAMTKKEAAAHAEQIDKLKLRVALCWTPEVRADISPPSTGSGSALTKGWLTAYDRVEPGCSSACYHSMGTTKATNTQGCRLLFSTRLLALMAVRHEMEKRFAGELRRVDDMIEAEKANPTPLPDK